MTTCNNKKYFYSKFYNFFNLLPNYLDINQHGIELFLKDRGTQMVSLKNPAI